MKVRAQKKGSIVFNRLRQTWNYLWVENGRRKSRKLGTLAELPTRAAAEKKAEITRRDVRLQAERAIPTVNKLIEAYRVERMPERFSTRYGYEAWIKNHILPHWGEMPITAVQPRETELWLRSLELAPKSRVHIRGVLHQLWEFAQWRGDVPAQRNPMELVTIKGATKRRKPHSLTEDEFRKFVAQLDGPVRMVALLCVSFGLRISECLALKFGDVDWLNSTIEIKRGIVRQRVGPVKTNESERQMAVDPQLLAQLKNWKQATEFGADTDWIFASPFKLGRLPISYPNVWLRFRAAAKAAQIPQFGTHSLRHTYRSFLDAVGTPIATQQRLMRHTDIRTTMNVYGDVVTNEMATAHSKVVQMVLPKAN
jgi:integrase